MKKEQVLEEILEKNIGDNVLEIKSKGKLENIYKSWA